jgi:MFS family permease
MLKLLERTYISVFRRYPMLLRMALVVLLGEVMFAIVNNYALTFYLHDDLRQPMRVVGIVISTFLVAEMCLKFPAGHLSDRYGRRRFASLGLAVCVGTPLAICVVPPEVFLATPALIYLILLPLRVTDGAGSAALWPPLFAAVPDHIPSEKRGVAMSVMNTAYLAGLALGPALAGAAMKAAWLLGRPDWSGRAPFVTAAVFALVAAGVAWMLPAQRSVSAEGEVGNGLALPPFRVIAIVIVITFSDMFATSVLAPYIAKYMNEVGGVPPSDVGFWMLLLVVPVAVLGMPIGHLTDRWEKRRVVQASLWTTAAGLWAVPQAHSLSQMLLAAALVMLGFMFGFPAWLALISDMAPQGGSGKIMGLMATAQGVGAFLGPLLGGVLWDADPTRRAPFYVAAALLTCSSLIAVMFIGRTRVAKEAGVTAVSRREGQDGA